jgi:hypothetical protein
MTTQRRDRCGVVRLDLVPVRKLELAHSCCDPAVVAQKSAEAFMAPDGPGALLCKGQGEHVVEALMVALMVIVLDVLAEDCSKMSLPERVWACPESVEGLVTVQPLPRDSSIQIR